MMIARRLLLITFLTLAGCSTTGPMNPSFPLTVDGAKVAIEEMKKEPIPLKRPVLVLSGYLNVGMTPRMETILRDCGASDQVLTVHFFLCGDFDRCREHLLRELEAAFPSNDPTWTTEVDIVAGSMGGIVARYAAMPLDKTETADDTPPRKRLKIARLFTVSTPHKGAELASIPTIDSLVLDMRGGSKFLRELDAALVVADYEVLPYVRLRDRIVGAENSAPHGMSPWWVANQPAEFSHIGSFRDERILADIARRLRDEPPYTTSPASPLPEQ